MRDRERVENRRKMATTFAAVAEDFLTKYVDVELVKKADCRRMIMNDYVARFGALPIKEVTTDHIADAVRIVAARSHSSAHISFSNVRRMYSWAIGQRTYGIEANPCAPIEPTILIAKRVVRSRFLSGAELQKVWQAADQEGYAFGCLVKLLILTGQRLRECANATWSEIDFEVKLWTIPKARMKGERDHVIPLAPMALELLKSLPRWNKGNYVFAMRSGAKPYTGFPKGKVRIDKLSGVGNGDSDHWFLHDLRGTTRSNLSALAIEDRVREAMIAHAQPGMHQVYNVYDYQDEKRRGFTLWEQRLSGFINPKPPATVADLSVVRRKQLPARVA